MSRLETVDRWKLGRVPVLLEQSHSVPLVDVEITLRTGTVHDPVGLEGLTRLTWRMVRMGTRSLRGPDVEEAISRLGARLTIHVAASYVQIHGVVIRRNLEAFAELLSKLLLAPAFRVADLSRVKREVTAELVAVRDNDRALAARVFRRTLFGEHPYGRPATGTRESIRAIKRKHIVACYEQHFVEGNLLYGFAGDVTPEQGASLLERYFGQVPRGRAPREKLKTPRVARGRRLVVIDKPDRTQTQLCLGTLGSKVGDPLYYPLMVANTAFGGTFTATLMQEIREKRGWSYGAYSRLGGDRQRDAWYMWTFPTAAYAADCMALQLELFDQFAEEGVTTRQHRFAKGYLVKSHCFEVDTAVKRLEPHMDELVFGLPEGYYSRYVQDVRKVKPKDSQLALRKRLSGNHMVGVIVATAAQVCPALEKIPGVTSVDVVAHDSL